MGMQNIAAGSCRHDNFAPVGIVFLTIDIESDGVLLRNVPIAQAQLVNQ